MPGSLWSKYSKLKYLRLSRDCGDRAFSTEALLVEITDLVLALPNAC